MISATKSSSKHNEAHRKRYKMMLKSLVYLLFVGVSQAQSPSVTKLGVFDYSTQESSPIMFNGVLLMVESVPTVYANYDPLFSNCSSYFRVRDMKTLLPVVNITLSCGQAFASAMVIPSTTGASDTLIILGTQWDRNTSPWSGPCSGQTPGSKCSVNMFVSSSRTLEDSSWISYNPGIPLPFGVFNTDMMTVPVAANSPWTFVIALETTGERARFLVTNNSDPTNVNSWISLNDTYTVPPLPDTGSCPSLRHDGQYYYYLTGGTNIHILRSKDLISWTESSSNVLTHSDPGDCIVAPSWFGPYIPSGEAVQRLNKCGISGNFGDDSDIDLIEWPSPYGNTGNGPVTLIEYGSGDQATFGFSNLAQFNGSLITFLQSFFPASDSKDKSNELRPLYSEAALSLASSSLASLPWNFSWTTLPTFAFPGAAPRFMTNDEEQHFNNFSMMLIWGLNATCLDGSEPECKNSFITCNKTDPYNQKFVLSMETSLQEQGRRLKARRGSDGFMPVLGYIEYLSAQQYYAAHAPLLYDPAYADWRLSIQSKGVIDCMRDGCDWQGTEMNQWDLRQPQVRDYYVNNVIGWLVNETNLDGTFLDVVEWWTSECSNWGCTAQEQEELTSASLVTLQAVLESWPNKVFSASSHTWLGSNDEFYLAQLAILKGSGNGIRFWEFFNVGNADHIQTLIYETQTVKVPVHVHVTSRTLAPDWVELAAFLIGCDQYSYFSYSGPWMLDSFDFWPEFSKALGQPLGPPTTTITNSSVQPWVLLDGQNLIDNWPNEPNNSSDVYQKLAFLGVFDSVSECMTAIRANSSFVAMTYVKGNDDQWTHSCWGRLETNVDYNSCIVSQNSSPPCYSDSEPGKVVSAVGVELMFPATEWNRDFESLSVSLSIGTQTGPAATLLWK
jgi:hypothetical protein